MVLIKKNIKIILYLFIFFAFILIAFILNSFFPRMYTSPTGTTIEKLVKYSFLPHFYLFLAGVLIQRLNLNNSNFVQGKACYWLIGYTAFSYILPASIAKTITGNLILAITVISVAYSGQTLSHRMLRGYDISYGIYISWFDD